MVFLITTTGVKDEVVFDDLGERSFSHPTTDHDLSLEYTYAELNASKDLQEAIDNGGITAKDENGNTILQLYDVFGSNNLFIFNKEMISTTSTKYVEVLVLETVIPTKSKYRVGGFYQYRYYGVEGIGFSAHISIDGRVVFENSNNSFCLKNEDSYIPVCFFDYVYFDRGAHIILLEMALVVPEGLAPEESAVYIKDTKLEIWRTE